MTLQKNEQFFNGIVEWQGIQIEIDQHMIFSNVGRTGITVKSLLPKDEPLPISETGFKSLYPAIETVEQYGGVESYIIKYLDNEAAKPEWAKTKKRNAKEIIEQVKINDAAKQIDLFGAAL